MESVNLKNQGMLKILQDIYRITKDGKRETASNICMKVGLEHKYWRKIYNAGIVINIGKSTSYPCYKWNAIEPNIYMANETLKEYPYWESLEINIPPWDIKPLIHGECQPNKSNEEIRKNEMREYIDKFKSLSRCLHCGTTFIPKKATDKYCSLKCKKAYIPKPPDLRLKANREALFNIPEEPKQENIIPPKIEWVEEYCAQRDNGINPEQFINYYTSKEWRIGKNKMLNWKRAIMTWEQNQKRPKQINVVSDISKLSDKDLIAELKKRGYSGDINLNIKL